MKDLESSLRQLILRLTPLATLPELYRSFGEERNVLVGEHLRHDAAEPPHVDPLIVVGAMSDLWRKVHYYEIRL
jgi:hypothetical protein